MIIMPNAVKMFPAAYGGGYSPPTSDHVVEEGDAEITALWEEYSQPTTNTHAWAFRKRVFRAALRVLGPTKAWYYHQDANPALVGYSYAFLQDTLRYIHDGSRRFSVQTWTELIMAQAPQAPANHRRALRELHRELALPETTAELVQSWVGRPGGFDDFMQTLHVLFGNMTLRQRR